MRLTSRERLMLIAFVLLLIVTGIIYYIYLPVYDNLTNEKNSLVSNQKILTDIEKNILPLEQQIMLIDNFREKVEIMKRTLPPVIYQEDIIRKLYATMELNNVDVVEYSFGQESTKAVQNNDQEAIDKILSGYEDTILDNISKNMVEARFESDEQVVDEVPKTWKDTVDKISVTVNLQGEYENLMRALNDIEKYENLSVITGLSIAKEFSNKNHVVGSVDIIFPYYYDNETLEKVDWIYESEFEKHQPFNYIIKGSQADPDRPIVSTGVTSNPIDLTNIANFNQDSLQGLYDRQAEEEAKLKSDFEVILSAPTSILNGYFITKSDQKDFSLSSDRESEEISITLTEAQGSVSYAYSTSLAKFPSGDEFISFNPNYEDAIYISIVSSPRVDEKDVGMCNLSVYNQTSKQVKIIVNTDDDKLPRLNMSAQEGNVIVVRN